MTISNGMSDQLRILLVEDDPESMNLTLGMLHDMDIQQVFTANNGVEAFELLSTFEGEDCVDVVLCDWNMPEMNGIELLKKVRTSDPELLFFMVTGQADFSSVLEAKTFGIDAYIKKPFSTNDLRKKLTVASRIIARRKGETAD